MSAQHHNAIQRAMAHERGKRTSSQSFLNRRGMRRRQQANAAARDVIKDLHVFFPSNFIGNHHIGRQAAQQPAHRLRFADPRQHIHGHAEGMSFQKKLFPLIRDSDLKAAFRRKPYRSVSQHRCLAASGRPQQQYTPRSSIFMKKETPDRRTCAVNVTGDSDTHRGHLCHMALHACLRHNPSADADTVPTGKGHVSLCQLLLTGITRVPAKRRHQLLHRRLVRNER